MTPIPYDQQPDSERDRMCGASCVVMVLRSLGEPANRRRIWDVVKLPDRFDTNYTMTYRLTQYLLERKLRALAIRVKDPIATLSSCNGTCVRAILCCRRESNMDVGHFMVFVRLENNVVVVHDPEKGPNREKAYGVRQR